MTNPPTQVSPFRPLLWLGVSLMGGIVLASLVHLAALIWLLITAAGLLLAVLLTRVLPQFRRLPLQTRALLGLCLVVLPLGGWRYQVAQPIPSPGLISWYNDQPGQVQMTGWLVAPADERDSYTNLKVRITTLELDAQVVAVGGLVLVRVQPGMHLQVGDVLHLSGNLRTPGVNEDFNYRDFLARQGIQSILQSASVTPLPFRAGNLVVRGIYLFRDRLLTLCQELFPEPEASLLSGILLGVDSGLPETLQQAFRDTGTSHIIAISGFNIAILSALFIAFFGRLLGKRKGALAAVVGLALYTLLVGAEASVLRAGIMGVIAILGTQLGRRQDSLNTLGFTAGLMCLFNPNLPWDVGFQLSFAATMGLVLYAGKLTIWTEKILVRRMPQVNAQKTAQPIAEYLLFSLAAQVTTLPLMAYHFNRISLVSLLANPFVLPLQPALMVTSGLALLTGLVYLPLGRVLGWLAWPFSLATIKLVEAFARLPHATIPLGQFSLLVVDLIYLVLFGVTFRPTWLVKPLQPVLRPAILLAGLSVLSLLTWRTAFSAPDGRLHLYFFQNGSADSILIRTPGGETILIDGGVSHSSLAADLGRQLSPFDHRLDLLVVASTLEEQLAALPGTLEQYPPSSILWSGAAEASRGSLRLEEWLKEKNISIQQAQPGMTLELGQSARLNVLAVTSRGAVLQIEYLDFSALLPIGQDFNSLKALSGDVHLRQPSILLLADSGLAALNPPEWIQGLQPQVCILSVSAADAAGRPDPETLAAVGNLPLLRTDLQGWIHVTSDGHRMWIETQRPAPVRVQAKN